MSVELASAVVPAADSVAELDRMFGLSRENETAVYCDATRGVEKRARFSGNLLTALRVTGELTGAARLKQAMLAGSDIAQLRLRLLAPLADLAGLPQARGRTICSCLNVGEEEICNAIAAGHELAGLQATLKCGTQCGSCVPELKRLLADVGPSSVAAPAKMAVAL